jgi:hypothetical protein
MCVTSSGFTPISASCEASVLRTIERIAPPPRTTPPGVEEIESESPESHSIRPFACLIRWHWSLNSKYLPTLNPGDQRDKSLV